MKKLLITLISLEGLAIAVWLVAAITWSGASGPSLGHYTSHDRFEADRIMTQQMSVDVGPGMQGQMPANGMLQRSADPGYLRPLEGHTYWFQKSIGGVP